MKSHGKDGLSEPSIARQMATESDRGCAIIGCSLLEEHLGKILRAKMARCADGKQVEALFEGYGPLSTFSAKIAVCHAFGFIDDKLRHDLDIVRRIRNKFAHEYGKREFFDNDTFQQLSGIRCSYPLGTLDMPGATLDGLKATILEFSPSDGKEPKDIEVSAAKGKFLFTVLLLSQRLAPLAVEGNTGAEPQGGGYSPPAARPTQPTP